MAKANQRSILIAKQINPRPEDGPAPPAGLCRTCNNWPDCTFPRTGSPVRHCDELDHPGQRIDSVGGQIPLTVVPAPDSLPDQDDPELLGLCRACEKRFDCTFPKPEWGVWNCEEFI